jgi:hypothetical protein
MNLLDGAGEVLADDLALEGATLVEGEVFVVLLVHEQHREEQRDLVTGRAPPPLPFFRSKVCRCCLSPVYLANGPCPAGPARSQSGSGLRHRGPARHD